jgi:hypothetical protein
MIEKNFAIKYWKEAINTIVHTLNQVQLKKDLDQTPYELWYGYKPNVYYFKVFGSKCYILKESRKGKIYVKSDDGIFIGYFNKRKAYKCLNLSTHKVIESAHAKIDEFVEECEEQNIKELENYINFFYCEPDTLLDVHTNTIGNQQSPPLKLQQVQPESQSEGPESQVEGPKFQLVQTKPFDGPEL